MIEEDIYTYRTLPWLSKSTILGYRFCQYLFDLRYNKGIDAGVSVKAETGTNIHVLYDKFFDIVDYDELKKIVINHKKELINTRVYHYFYKLLMEMIPVDSRAYKPYQWMIRNFALLEADHWISLNLKYPDNYIDIQNYFIPIAKEKYSECPSLMIFGTVDRINNYEEGNLRIIYDYKTGRVPVDVRKGPKSSDIFSWKLPPKKSFELHYYLILAMTQRGFTIHPDIVAFCTQEEYFKEGVKVPKVDSYFFNSQGEPVKAKEYYRLGMIFSGDEKQPYVPKKEPIKRSLTAVFKWINFLRYIIKNKGPFNKEPNFWKCRECNETVRERCLTEEESKMIFWTSETYEKGENIVSTKDDVHK